ncbi:N-6 DNA methylase [Fibrobacter sp. UWH1]|uniref:N-6 DNA methylase n=1 Tax=Fibrobacter sp. UWH1 TaxID=1964354 RepID=UPI0015954A0D|nr:N-6 DNA methylase [Fibrobacter sp. UWH1]
MSGKISLTEAASFLGVSKATLRNWDKDKKLCAKRNPLNGYRTYDLNEIIKIKNDMNATTETESVLREKKVDTKAIKSLINKLHNIIRNEDSDSNTITRFDEISKLLFLKMIAEKEGSNLFFQQLFENESTYSIRVQNNYQDAISNLGIKINSFSKIQLSESALWKCGKELSCLNLNGTSCDVKGLAYEDAIRGVFDKNDNQQFFTPYQIVDFIVKIFKSHLKGTICDPACGTAGFLNQASKANCNANLLGFEVDERLAWISNLNLLLHGNKHYAIKHMKFGGSLGQEAKKFFGKIDVILTNPPFGSDYTDPSILNHYLLGKERNSRRRGILFIEQVWNFLKDKGYAAIIIDQSVLNANSNIDVRQYILSHFQILAIIDLPETAFMPYATVNTSILFLQKNKKIINREKTFYAKSFNIGRKNNGDDDYNYRENGTTELNSDLCSIVHQWENFNSGKKICDNCFSTILDFKEDNSLRLDYAYHHPFRNHSKELLNKSNFKLLPLVEVCEERNETLIPSTESEFSTIQFTGLANIESYTGKATRTPTPTASIKSSVKRYEVGDIIFSKMRPALRKCAVMKYEDGGYASSECTILKIRKDKNGNNIIDSDLLCAILRSDFVYGQIMGCITGIGRPRISGKDLRNIKIPVPPEQIQKNAITSMNTAKASIKQLKEKAALLLAEAEILEKNSLTTIANIMSGI